MPISEDLFSPASDVIGGFIENIIEKKLSMLSKELGLQLTTKNYLHLANSHKYINGDQLSLGECRMAFWRTFNEDRCLFEVAARFPNLNHETGFSGFDIKGQIKSGEIAVKGYVVVYNVKNWPKWCAHT